MGIMGRMTHSKSCQQAMSEDVFSTPALNCYSSHQRRLAPGILSAMTILREEFHRVVDELPETELAPLLDYVRAHTHRAAAEAPVWDGPDFLGAFASGRSDVSEHADELLFNEHPTDGPPHQ